MMQLQRPARPPRLAAAGRVEAAATPGRRRASSRAPLPPAVRAAPLPPLPRGRHAPRAPCAAAADGLPSGDPAAALQLPSGPPAGASAPLPRFALPRARAALSARIGRARSAFVSDYDAELFGLAIPALASMLLDPIMNVISASMIGHLGTQQMAAVSLGSLAVSFATFTFGFLVFLTTPKVAAAHVVGDKARVSRHAAVGLWLALACGLVVTGGLVTFSDSIIAVLRPPEPAVAEYAGQFIRIRAWSILSALISFVAAGTYRGVKDTVTPLQAAAVATGSNLILSLALIYGLEMGVAGAALAATISSWVSAAMLVWLLFRKRLLRPADAAAPPAWREVRPYVSQGLFLAFRMVLTFGIIMYASAMCVRLGAASQASFEVIRQLWILSIQLFECLNVATQSMAASLLGAGEPAAARALLRRATALSVAVGVGVGATLLLFQTPLVAVFTSDAAVAALSLEILPMIALLMPVDAGASIADGGFIAAGQTNTLSAIQVAGSVAQYAVLSWALAAGLASTYVTWGVLKLMSVFRFAGGAYMHFYSPRSAYRARGEAGGEAGAGGGGESDVGSGGGAAAAAAAAAAAGAGEGDAAGGAGGEGEWRRWEDELWVEAQRELDSGDDEARPSAAGARQQQEVQEQDQQQRQQQHAQNGWAEPPAGHAGGGAGGAELRRRPGHGADASGAPAEADVGRAAELRMALETPPTAPSQQPPPAGPRPAGSGAGAGAGGHA